MKNLLVSTLFILSAIFRGHTQSNTSVEFVENKGQWNDKVAFKAEMNAGAVFFTSKGMVVLQHNKEDLLKLKEASHGSGKSGATNNQESSSESVMVRSHAYEMEFLNAKNPTITAAVSNAYNNFFIGDDPSKWASNCKISNELVYKNVYPNIDVRYYTHEGTIKYDILVKPGGNVNHIALSYSGVDGIELSSGNLIIKTSVDEVKELAPYSYQENKSIRNQVLSKYIVSGNTVRFNVNNYDKSKTLVIDPQLVFSTFTGSTADNWGHCATYGAGGTFYSGGIVFGSGFPTSVGAFQTMFNGGNTNEGTPGYDMAIMKFNANGTNRMYATYTGGSGNDQPISLLEDAQGNLIIYGRTNSANYPVTNPNYGTGGDVDIVLTKLNATGTSLLASRRIGGSEKDGVNVRQKFVAPYGAESIRRNYGDDSRGDIQFDNAGNILLASCTKSSNFPTTAGAFQTTFGGQQDGIILKLTADLGSILFSSLLGGSYEDAAFVVAQNPLNNNIYIGGNTNSTNLQGDKSGVIYPTYQSGISDAFISIISNTGASLLKTTYIGTAGNDMLYGLHFDKLGYPYIMGTTTGVWPIANAAFSVPGAKQFIAKLKPDLSAYEYSTTFGTNSPSPNICPTAFFVDKCENTYVVGWGGQLNNGGAMDPGYPNSGTNGLVTTPQAIQASTDGSDFYLFALSRNAGSQLYGSFFGQNNVNAGDHSDGGASRFDSTGTLYQAMCANCGRSAVFPITPGVWSPTNGSANCNLAAIKIAFNLCSDSVNVQFCPNGSGIINSSITGTNYQWQVNTGSGFSNISNNSNYAGANSIALQLSNIPSSWYGYTYRAIVDGSYSLIYKIKFANSWLGSVSTAWEDPANWSCGVVPDNNTDVIITSGSVVLSSNTSVRSLTVSPGANLTVTPGNVLLVMY